MTFSKRIKDKIEPYYQSDNLTEEFYKPVLKEAKSYKRVSAYFSSSGLGLYPQVSLKRISIKFKTDTK